jgi:serine/threonine protein kinase
MSAAIGTDVCTCKAKLHLLLSRPLLTPRPPRSFCTVMELMETSLESLLLRSRRAPLPLPKVLHIAVEICRGLEYLHPHIVHRCATALACGT